ncbi:ABC transporter permease, partial [Paenibacillus kobensis]|uniref:ABC transporter permease n=1 Tax=Paenibacillus kobensis TaxID=59841 RepID=UPI0013E2CCBF
MNILETIGQLLNSTAAFSAALILAALGGICSERAGVVNIGLEGLMTAGAFAAAVTADYASRGGAGSLSPWLGLLGAVIFASLFALLHAVATVTFRSNQVVTGVVINFLALGIGVYLVKSIYHGSGQSDTLKEVFHQIKVPYAADIPLLGEALFHAYPTTYIALVLTAAVWYAMFRSKYGLRLRAV